MSKGGFFGWTTKQDEDRSRSDLRLQIVSKLNTFFAVRGLSVLSNSQNAVVLRKDFDSFVTAELRGIEDPQSIVAVVPLRDLDSYQKFKTVQSDNSLRGSALGQMALAYLADQVTTELLKQIGNI